MGQKGLGCSSPHSFKAVGRWQSGTPPELVGPFHPGLADGYRLSLIPPCGSDRHRPWSLLESNAWRVKVGMGQPVHGLPPTGASWAGLPCIAASSSWALRGSRAGMRSISTPSACFDQAAPRAQGSAQPRTHTHIPTPHVSRVHQRPRQGVRASIRTSLWRDGACRLFQLVGCLPADRWALSGLAACLQVRAMSLRRTCDGKPTVHPRTLWVRGSNLTGGSQPAKLPLFGGYSLEKPLNLP